MDARFALAVGLLLSACKDADPPAPSSPPGDTALAPLAFEFAGCAQVRRGPVCLLAAGPEANTLRLRAREDTCDLVVDDRPVVPGAGPSAVVTPGPESLASGALRLRCGDRRASLTVGTAAEPPLLDGLRGLPPDEALAALGEALRSASGEAAARLLYERARVENRTGRVDAARETLGQAISAADAEERIDLAVRARLLRAFLATTARDFAPARADIGAALARTGDWAEGRMLGLFHRAVLERESGSFRAAVEALEATEALALDLVPAFRDAVANERAALGQALGRPEEVIAGLTAVLGPNRTDCAAVPMLGNLAWAQLRLREADPAAAADPEPTLRRLRALEAPCEQPPTYRQATRLNLAFAALLAGRAEDAERALAESAALPLDVEASRWRLDLEGRLALRRGRNPQARAAYGRLLALGQAAGEPEVVWRAHDGLARIARQAGRPRDAIAAWRAAEGVLDTAVARVPVDAGRQRFLGALEGSARGLVEALAVGGPADVAEAAAVARRARRRALEAAALQARLARATTPADAGFQAELSTWRARRRVLEAEAADDWRLSAGELAAARRRRIQALDEQERALSGLLDGLAGPVPAAGPPPSLPDGTAEVVFFPGERGWFAFLRRFDSAETRAVLLGPPPDRLTPEWALGPVVPHLGGVTRLRVLAHGPLRALDLHAARLAAEGRPAVSTWAFEYPLDLSTPTGTVGPANRPRRFAVVADARGDLAAALHEADRVEGRARTRGLTVAQALRGPVATAEAVRGLLADVDVLHFAGHGAFAGREGYEGALLLAGEDRLTVGDVLLLPRVPGRLVLSACEAARTAHGPGQGAEGLGIAQALVLAGAGQVVAANRAVRDEAAFALMESLYGEADPDDFDLAWALARAQRAMIAQRPGDDWVAFRVVVP
jgi:hypothetical protein